MKRIAKQYKMRVRIDTGSETIALKELEQIVTSCKIISSDPNIFKEKYRVELQNNETHVADIRVEVLSNYGRVYHAEIRESETGIGFCGLQTFGQSEINKYLSKKQ